MFLSTQQTLDGPITKIFLIFLINIFMCPRSLPFGLQWVGGSDWVTLHRDFAHYLVTSDDALVRGLTSWYFYAVLAPESFFHTALVNSR